MSTSIQIRGTKQASRYLRSVKNNITNLQKEMLGKAAILVQGNVKKSIAGREAEPKSVDSGRFLNSVEVNVGKTDAKVFSNLIYARTLEFGGQNRSARRHFQNSAARSKAAVNNILNAEIKSTIRRTKAI